MTLHYHGTPISPRPALYELAGHNFCVSFAAPTDIKVCHEIGQSVMLDNGAFSMWTKGKEPDWPGYYKWCEEWLACPTTWAVIPDVVDGGTEENDALLRQCPFKKGAPVWHLHEPIIRLEHLVNDYERVCFGSSGQYATVGDDRWHHRVTEAWNRLGKYRFTPWIHMLRGMSLAGGIYPFASLDSTDVGRNHNRPQNGAAKMAKRWDAQQCAMRWHERAEQTELVVTP